MDWEFEAEVFQWHVETSLIPRDGIYLVPLKVALRRPEHIDDGDVVRVRLSVAAPTKKVVPAIRFHGSAK